MHLIPESFSPDLNATITTLLVLYMLGKLAAWAWAQMRKNPLLDTVEQATAAAVSAQAAADSAGQAAKSAEEAAKSASAAAATAMEGLQVGRETRAVATETRELVRDLREADIRHSSDTRAVLDGLTATRAAVDRLVGSVSELVGEIRAGRRAA